MKLVEDYRQLHEAKAFGGMTIVKFSEYVVKLCRRHECISLLDYGSGRGLAWEKDPLLKELKENVGVLCYDPGVPGQDIKPARPSDAVVCIDVIEHIPEDEVMETLGEIFGLATKMVFATFCQRGSKKKLPSTGQDVHITQKPRIWWEERFHQINSTRTNPIPWYLFENP